MQKIKRKYESRVTPAFAGAGSPLRKQGHESRIIAGSALILTVVLTSLLAIVGVLFVMVARIEKISTSAVSENKELDYAVQTVITNISEELVLDVNGTSVPGGDFYDYPDANNMWLASLEPYEKSSGNYYWRHISDVYYKPDVNEVNLEAEIIPDYQEPSVMTEGHPADADGDGAADSCWVIVPNITSSKGEPIYAAIRIIDNAGMLNVNTAYKFDPNGSLSMIDGSSQMQINLMALSWRPGTTFYDPSDETDLLKQRANPASGLDPNNLNAYEQDVIWRYGQPNGPYTPFDISDELELRYRFLLNHTGIDTRLERWGGEFRKATSSTPFRDIDEWFISAYDKGNLDQNYAYRHIATTYNMDRIIRSDGGKMLNVNTASAQELYNVLKEIINPSIAAQISVNLIDFRDDDDNVTSFAPEPTVGQIYYGFECPCIYISELVYNSVTVGDPPTTHIAYAIELYKPYSEDGISGSGLWQIVVDGAVTDIDAWWPGNKKFYIIQKEDPPATIDVNATNAVIEEENLIFGNNSQIRLQRYVADVNNYITVDYMQVPGWLVSGDGIRSFRRDISNHKCIRRLWDSSAAAPTLGSLNGYIDTSKPETIQAHPYLDPLIYESNDFKNIGEIGMILTKSAYYDDPNPIGLSDTETTVRLDLSNPIYQRIFNYLTVFDPSSDGINNDDDHFPNGNDMTDETDLLLTPELKIPGRININTAPWFVIRQLPWMDSTIAKAIVNYRGTIGGYKSIGELMQVPEMGLYSYDDIDLDRYPDLTPSDSDGARWNFEERDVIFARISNLITVRSDVFTAYILVRLGNDGPQRRVIATLDRSNVYPDTAGGTIGEVKIVALHQAPDPR